MLDAWCWVSAGAGFERGGGGAIACIELGGDVEAALAAIGIKQVSIGDVRRRTVPVGAASDDAVVARWSDDRATVMTHGGRAIVEGFLAACELVGIPCEVRPRGASVEADDEIEARMLAKLARAQSPAAIDLLLDQPRRWRQLRDLGSVPLHDGRGSERDAALRRLIEPALVVAVGPPNIGKSSLLNALAGRGVAVVADQPGTTRDHVGALIDLAGVVVRWVDTPGLEDGKSGSGGAGERGSADDAIQREAQRLALEIAARADVLVVCCDASAAIAQPTTSGKVVRVGLRSDMGRAKGVDAAVSVRDGTGLEQLVASVREAAVPRRYFEDGEPWVFW